MHKFAVIHKPSKVVCYTANRVNHCIAPNDNYQIVSLDSNANQFTTVACNLSFNNYSEIVAALSGEFVGFYTDENDNLSISNESRTVVIPALLFRELCLDVEEVVFGDVCELVDDNEEVAYEAIHKWVASRLLANDTTETTNNTNDNTTNNATAQDTTVTNTNNTTTNNTTTNNTTTNNTTTNNTTTAQDTTVNTVKKFTLKFGGFDTTRPGATCESENFWSVLYNEYSEMEGKRLLIGHFIAAQNYKSYENKQPESLWSYTVTTKSNTTTVYAAPEIKFLALPGDLETMQRALTQAKVGATFFDSQITKQLDTVGIPATRANIRVYRKPYIAQISKLLLEEILNKRSTATVVRWFDRTNGNSYFSVRLSSGQFSINVPLAYGYDNAENLVVRALRLEQPRTMRARAVLEELGINVVDLGYCTKCELYKAAFHI